MDLALALLRRGYHALPAERRRNGGADTFVTRMLGGRAVVVRGRAGAELFYDTDRVSRVGAVPPPVAGLIFGRGALHGLDGAEHAERKALFLDLLDGAAVQEVTGEVTALLRPRLDALAAQPDGGEVVLFDLLVEAYGDAVLRWAGVPGSAEERRVLARRMAAIVDGFGGAGTAYVRGWRERLRLNRWAARLVRETRRTASVDATSVVARIAATDLDDRTAGVELLNVLRPTVAVAWPATWAALTLAVDRSARAALVGDAGARARVCVAHESRRVHPFVPALAGRIRSETEHDGVRLRPGDHLVLDVPGTDTDPAWWDRPEELDPSRFAHAEPDPYAYVPQGGGHPDQGHRCPGEPLTVALVATTLGELARHDITPVDDQPGRTDRTRMPRRPHGGLRLRVRTTDPSA
ncbi:cytochrome P450 [Nocardioides sp. CPCC 205120]|uniref:cytochrome P450 n=1 Tax=Nocardioides sp. CPCC 205120 TaxID=3406462 RepID=UPI003B51134B